jgi:hypothetical protein
MHGGGNVDEARFAKQLPQTAARLREKNTSPDDVAQDLTHRCLASEYRSNYYVGDKLQITTTDRFRHICKVAALGILEGLDQVTTACWECCLEMQQKNECGGCGVALYCGRYCQTAAWKTGHKQACSSLGPLYKAWKEDLELVDANHEIGEVEGIALSDELDHSVLSSIHSPKAMIPYRGLGNPTMSAFYDNRGEWWLYPKNETKSISSFKNRIRRGRITGEDEMTYLITLT